MPDVAVGYEAIPHNPWAPGREAIVSQIMRDVARLETLFSDFQKACSPICDDTSKCDACASRLKTIAKILTSPQAFVWEVWKMGDSVELVGIVFLTDVRGGMNARAHYVFFDGDLKSKTPLLEKVVEWCFEDHENWVALRRLTVEIPAHAFALARHAVLKLGFGGPYRYTMPGKKHVEIPVEGVMRGAYKKNGQDLDILILGRLNGRP